jgi:cephalosporin hydroxylase
MLATIKNWIPDRIKNKWKKQNPSPSVFDQPVDFEFVNKIQQVDLNQLTNPLFLENTLIPQLGLNNESLHEFPKSLYPHCGFGLFIWQYPNQLAPLLEALSHYNINSYLEVGVRHGGMFATMVEWLSRVNQSEVYGLAVDITPSSPLEKFINKQSKLEYWIGDSQSISFKNYLRSQPHFDLTLIDADHSYEGCLADFNAVKEQSGIILFHDIVSDVCPGVVQIWNEVKSDPTFKCLEFTNQYSEISSKGESYLGIGMAINQTLTKTSN